MRILRGGSNASFLVAVSQPKIDDSRSVTGILVVVIYSIPIEWLIWEGSMSQKMRWKTDSDCPPISRRELWQHPCGQVDVS